MKGGGCDGLWRGTAVAHQLAGSVPLRSGAPSFGAGQVDMSVIPYSNFLTLYDAGAPVKIVAGAGVDGCILIAKEGIKNAAGGLDVRKHCRALLIEAKLHAGFAFQRTGNAEKKEMMEWMRVWLENPGVFPLWVEIRRKAI